MEHVLQHSGLGKRSLHRSGVHALTHAPPVPQVLHQTQTASPRVSLLFPLQKRPRRHAGTLRPGRPVSRQPRPPPEAQNGGKSHRPQLAQNSMDRPCGILENEISGHFQPGPSGFLPRRIDPKRISILRYLEPDKVPHRAGRGEGERDRRSRISRRVGYFRAPRSWGERCGGLDDP